MKTIYGGFWIYILSVLTGVTSQGTGWILVFKAVNGAGGPDIYDLWHGSDSLNVLTDGARDLNADTKAHFKSPLVERWSELDIRQVRISFYKNNIEEKFIIFNTDENGDKDNWFAIGKISRSNFADDFHRKNFDHFSLEGDSISFRRFFTSKTFNEGCEKDVGWTVVITGQQQMNCRWATSTSFPIIMFSENSNGVNWQTGSPAMAEFMTISLGFTENCPYEVVTKNGVEYTFEASPSNFLAHALELCSETNEPIAVRMCNLDRLGGANWGEVTVQLCENYDIHELAQVTVTEENVEEVALQLSILTNEENLDDMMNLNDIASILEDITDMGTGNSKVTEFTVAVVSNVQNADDQIFTSDNQSMSASSSIVKSLETQLASLQDFKEVEDNVAVQTKMYPADALQSGIGFASFKPSTDDPSGLQADNIETFEDADEFLMEMIETSIALPSEIVDLSEDQTGNKDQLQVSFIVYQTSKLFTSQRLMLNPNRTVGSRVISATVEQVTVEGLHKPVKAAYLPVVDGASGNPECVFWDFNLENGQGDWSNDGCYYNKTSDGRIVCYCDHLTNFAVIMDYSGQGGESSKFQDALTYISIIGCVISIVCLVITIFTFSYFRHLRGKRPQRILINLCSSLLCLYLTFVIGIEMTKYKYGCIVIAILLHYFVLTSLFWMLVEAINMYLKFVLVFYDEIRCFMFKSVLLGWVVPIIPVAVIAVMDYEGTYSNEDYCFMNPGLSLYLGLLAVSAVVLIINFAIYVQIIRRLTCRRTVSKRKTDRARMEEISVRLQNAIAIMMLLGLTWIFGFFAVDSSETLHDLFQLLFCVFNSLQGFFIFLLFCVRRKDVRDSWAYSSCNIGEKPGSFATTTSKQRYATEKTTVSSNSIGRV